MSLLIPLAWLTMGLTVPLTGTVEDAAGRPVAGATVWLGDTYATQPGPEVLATAKTDDRGRFRLDRAEDLAGRGGSWSPTLWAFQPGSRVAFLEFKRSLPAADNPVRLILGPPASATLRVLGADGQPAAGARVVPAWVNFGAPRPPDGMLDRIGARADDDGRATIEGLAPEDFSAVDVTARGQLVQCLPIDLESGIVSLRPLGRLGVRVVADDPKAARGWSITARSRPSQPDPRGPSETHWARETTGEEGRVDFPALAEGVVAWEIRPPEGSDYLAAEEPPVRIRAGEAGEVAIPVRRGIRVEGVLRLEPGGAPVAGIKLSVFSFQGRAGGIPDLITDAQGRFSAVVPSGLGRCSISTPDLPMGFFLPPDVPHWVDFVAEEGEARREVAPPPLRKAASVRGRVVEEAGGPAAWVDITGTWTSAEFGNSAGTVRALADDRGEFALGGIAPLAEVRLSAASGWTAQSDTATVARAGLGGPITLRLKNKPTQALAGRVLGLDGSPVAGASIRVRVRLPEEDFSSGGEFEFAESEGVRTGPDGRFGTPARLPVGYHYRVEAQAPGFEPAGSAWLIPPGQTVPDLRLRRAIGRREVVGRVVDSAGSPVAGAKVFQSGDGPRRTRVVTDGAGRYRVSGIPEAPAFLFVAREGYRFVGRRLDPGDRAVDFALRRLDEPPASPLRPVASPVTRDEERAIARELLVDIRRAAVDAGEDRDNQQAPEILGLVDPDRALAMIQEQVIPPGPALLSSMAVARYEADPKGARELLAAIAPPDAAIFVILGLHDRLGSMAPPEFRRGLLEAAARRAREIEHPGHAAGQLARVADRWLDLGDLDRGAALVREARALAEKPGDAPESDPRDDLATALARVDLPSALELLEGRSDPQFQVDAVRAGIARRIAATDPAGARRVIGMIEESARGAARRDASLRLATRDLAAARELAAEDRDPVVRAILPAVAARARFDSDPEGARALLRESVERLGKLGDDEGAVIRPSPAVALARLLPLAIRIDPDRAPGYLWLALSKRPPLSALPEPAPVSNEVRLHYLDLAELAALVAPYDRAAAEAVFAPVAARLPGLDDQDFGLGREGPAFFRAAATFDARAARSLLDALPEDPAPAPNQIPYRHQSKTSSRVELARMLGLPPALRLRGPFQPDSPDAWLAGLVD